MNYVSGNYKSITLTALIQKNVNTHKEVNALRYLLLFANELFTISW